MRTTPVFVMFLSAALAAGACRGGDDSSGDDDAGDDDGGTPDGPNTDDASIYDIQQGNVAVGTQLNVRGVVVTAIDSYGERKGNIWVEEPDGGAYSGVLVYGIDLGVVADLQVGDLVDLEGAVVDEFALTADTSGRTTTELVAPMGGAITATKVGTGTVPAPATVDALAIGQMADAAARDAEWEKWEGVLVQVQNVAVLKELSQIGSTPQDPPFEEIQVTGPLRVDTSLASINAVTAGDCLATITGIGDYFFNYKVLPRASEDIVTGGTGCPAQEADATACSDGTDNEADGFADCADFSCQTLSECQTSTTVEDVQSGNVTANSVVTLDNVYVIGVAFNRKHLWVADSLTAAPRNGIYVYRGSNATALPAEVVVGAQVDVTGTYVEFPNNPTAGTESELSNATVTFVAAPSAVATPLSGVAASTLVDETAGEPYESVLVTVGPLKVTTVGASPNYLTTYDSAGTAVVSDDTIFRPTTLVAGQCYSSVTGIWDYNTFENKFVLLPLDATSFVLDATGNACN